MFRFEVKNSLFVCSFQFDGRELQKAENKKFAFTMQSW